MIINEQLTTWTDLVTQWTLQHGIKIVLIPIAAYLLNRIGKRFIKKAIGVTLIHDRIQSKEADVKREETLSRIFGGALQVVIILIAAMMILEELGVAIGPILAGAGIVGLAFGFGGQYLIKDLITGLFLIIENQYRIGDVVAFDQTSGLVEDITLRITKLRDMDGTVHHVPHGSITRVANLTKDYSRVNLNLSVPYEVKLDQVIELINRVGIELAEDPQWKEVILTPPQFLRVDNFAESAIMLKILGDTVPIQQWNVTGELRKRLKIAFDREGIDLPYPQLVVHQKTANALQTAPQ